MGTRVYADEWYRCGVAYRDRCASEDTSISREKWMRVTQLRAHREITL